MNWENRPTGLTFVQWHKLEKKEKKMEKNEWGCGEWKKAEKDDPRTSLTCVFVGFVG